MHMLNSSRTCPKALTLNSVGWWVSSLIWIWLFLVVSDDRSLFGGEPLLELAVIHADLTPEPGDAACVGFMPKISTIEHPLELRGLLFRKNTGTAVELYVVAALDYCGLCNSSDDLLRQRLAVAAGTTPDHVALQSLHQHTAPVLDLDAAKLLHAEKPELWRAHELFIERMAARAATGAKAAVAKLQPVTRIIASQAKAQRVASNRRIVLPDGSIVSRLSASKDPKLQEAPEGLIDPWVRTLTFLNGETTLAQTHYYATHPQSFYGDERISWDVPGIARQRLQDETGVFQIYFNGCGGNIAMGKYNEGTRAAREELSERLYQAMKAAASVADPKMATVKKSKSLDTPHVVHDVRLAEVNEKQISWDVAPVKFVPREDGEFQKDRARDLIRAEQNFSSRLKASMATVWFNRLRAGHRVGISRLRIDSIQLIHLPGEPFIEFQLFAQQQAPESFVCVAGYGECGIWYYGPDRIFSDRGGYEQTWSFAEPCEELVQQSLAKLLGNQR